ncbi:hypothetical protein ADK57_35745 [Streptomyces sp. MMG1533]|nr:hypothetical protein ADK57_35745 [Streptomyces sp. MMG1533]
MRLWSRASQAKPAVPLAEASARTTRGPCRRTSCPPTGAASSDTTVLGSRYSTDKGRADAFLGAGEQLSPSMIKSMGPAKNRIRAFQQFWRRRR